MCKVNLNELKNKIIESINNDKLFEAKELLDDFLIDVNKLRNCANCIVPIKGNISTIECQIPYYRAKENNVCNFHDFISIKELY